LRNVDVIALPAALHLQTFSAVHVHQFEIIIRSARFPSLVRAAVPRELLHVGSIRPAVAGDVQNHTAIYVSNGVLPAAQVNEFPALICSAIAVELLDIGVLVRAVSEDVNAFPGIDVSDQASVLGIPLKRSLSGRRHSAKSSGDHRKQ
jgi:hypothetical protein